MFTATDETGFFRDTHDEKIGITTLVTITDSALLKLIKFLDDLFPGGWKYIKGNNITNQDREKVLTYIGHHQEIKYTSLLFDLSFGSDEWITEHKDRSILNLEKSLEKTTILPSMKTDILLLRNQVRKLSLGDYAKFVFITETYIDWNRYYQFDYQKTNIKNDSWLITHILDTQDKPDKFKRLIKSMMALTVGGASSGYTVYTPDDWSTSHPLLKNYEVESNKDLNNARKFYENFTIGNEQDYPILFLPDLIGNTIYLSITKRMEKKWLKYLKKLKSNRSLTITRGGRKDRYYIIRGFDKSKELTQVGTVLKEHYDLMLNLE